MKQMIYFALGIAGGYVLLLAAMFAFQRNLIYLPDTAIELPEHYGLSGFSDERTTTDDHLTVQLWYKPAASGFPTVIYYHGNAYHLGSRAAILSALAQQGFGVAALSYRGYGKSAGRPSEQGIYRDARAAIRFITGQKNIPLSQILLFGESLGSGVAVQMASEFPVAGLILQSPYTSVAPAPPKSIFTSRCNGSFSTASTPSIKSPPSRRRCCCSTASSTTPSPSARAGPSKRRPPRSNRRCSSRTSTTMILTLTSSLNMC
jgi:pimeloyl-ACP methyl ester carboxylesterase